MPNFVRSRGWVQSPNNYEIGQICGYSQHRGDSIDRSQHTISLLYHPNLALGKGATKPENLVKIVVFFATVGQQYIQVYVKVGMEAYTILNNLTVGDKMR